MARKAKEAAAVTSFDDFDEMVDNIISSTQASYDLSNSEDIEWVSSGNIAVNIALSGHPSYGLPFGRIINFEGESDTGKSLLAATLMREAQTKYTSDFRGLYIDTERGIDLARMTQMGMFVKRKPKNPNNPDPSKNEDTTGDPRAGTFRPIQTTNLTELCEKILPPFFNAAKANPNMRFILCVDSVSMLVTDHERTADFQTRDMARAQELRKFMRLINDAFCPNLMIFLIHHQSDVIRTNMYEKLNDNRDSKKTISGGKAMKYVPDVRIEVAYGKQETRGNGDKKQVVGQTCRVHVKKTRLYRPMITAEPVIDHSCGFTRLGGLFDQLLQLNIVVPNGKMFTCPAITGDDKMYRDNMADFLEREENVTRVVDLIVENLEMAAFDGGKNKDEEEKPSDLNDLDEIMNE